VVRHQTPSPNADPVPSAMVGQKVAIAPVIRIAEKRPHPPVTTLGHVVRNMWKDDAGEASHAVRLTAIEVRVVN